MNKRIVFVLEYHTGHEWRFYSRNGVIAPWYTLMDALAAARVELRRGAWSFCITRCLQVDSTILLASEDAKIIREGSTLEEAAGI